ncbi:MAG: general secretion pathway protein GspB [Luminiphilus sp.]|jgi:general secretion pathway protein B
MSLILDALRRSESEQRNVPSISVSDEVANVSDQRKARALVLGVAALALLGLGFWWFGSGVSTSGESVERGAVRPDGAIEEQVETPGLPIQPQDARQPVMPLAGISLPSAPASPASQVEVLDRVSVIDTNELQALNQAMWRDAATAAESVVSEGGDAADVLGVPQLQADPEERLEPDPLAVTETLVTEPAVDLQEVMQRLALEVGETSLLPHPVALLDTLTQAQKDSVPTIIYSAHQYGGDAAFVELNGNRLKEGERGDGIRVIEILPDSVILNVSGAEFRLKALNSWVNL